MTHRKKCFAGPAFESLDVLLDWIDSGFWVFIHHKPYHPSFVSNRMLGRVREEVKWGDIKMCYDENEKPYVSSKFDKAKIAALMLEIDKENQNLDGVPREFFGCIVGHDSVNHQRTRRIDETI